MWIRGPSDFQNFVEIFLCKDTVMLYNLHEDPNPIGFSSDVRRLVNNTVSRNAEECFKTFLDPDSAVDQF